jgi:hypothetical protein
MTSLSDLPPECSELVDELCDVFEIDRGELNCSILVRSVQLIAGTTGGLESPARGIEPR